ncbi:MAG: alpha-amylase family glycosyl hydrolase [Acidimicrobiales bacterium]
MSAPGTEPPTEPPTGGRDLALWAPLARRVELVVLAGPEGPEQRRVPMAPRPQIDRPGWFGVVDPELGPGTWYGFAVDGGPVRPDPRSRWQPAGVHAPSRIPDDHPFPWTDDGFTPAPLAEAVLYELHLGTFSETGTFRGAIDHLGHLRDLGVTHVELMPVAAFDGRHGWGYDGVDLFAPHPAYGDPLDLDALVDACHGHGLAVLIDVVHNHFGPSGCYLGELGPYVTDRYRTPWGGAVNVDGPGSDEVRRFFVESALAWLDDHHADGLRLDAVHAIVDTSARPFLEELGAAVADLARRTGRDLVVIAESDRNDPRLVHPVDRGGIGLDAHWCDDVHHALHVAATGETGSYYADFAGMAPVDGTRVAGPVDGTRAAGSVDGPTGGDGLAGGVRPDDAAAVVADVLRHGYHHRDTWSAFRGRRHGRPPEGVGGDQLVAFLQNHDQVGNRAAGERIAHLAGVDRQLAAAALVLLGRFVPLVFQGEEWAASTPFPYFADHADPELAEAVRQGRIAEFAAFGWPPEAVADPEDPATAAAARLRWDEVTDGDHARALAWYRDLVALRRTTPALRAGPLDQAELHADDTGVVRMRRGPIEVVANLGTAAVAVAVPPAATLVLASHAGVDRAPGPDGTLALPPSTAAVLRLDR